MMIAIGTIALLFIAVAAGAQTKDKNLNRKWMLIEYSGFTKEQLTELQAHIDLTAKNNTGTANMGCNNSFFNVKVKRCNRISFSAPGATMMYCEGRMKLEDEFGKLLPTISKYKVEGHYLTLKNKKGQTMKFIAEDWD